MNCNIGLKHILPVLDACSLKMVAMFEGKPPIAPGASDSQHATSVGGELCALDWAELKAKLSAARDLRRELASGDDSALASFDAGCAQRLASHQEKSAKDLTDGDEQRSVNPDDLANCKGVCANSGRHAENGGPANRGNT